MDWCAWRVGIPGGPTQSLAAWVMAKRVWQVGAVITTGVGAAVPLLTSVPCGSFFLESIHVNTHTLTHTHTHTHINGHARRLSAGFPLSCWTWHLTQELAIEKAGPSCMYLTLVVRSIVKVINMEGKTSPMVSLVGYYTYSLKQTLALTSNSLG